jgi:hypothetical protein
MANDHKELLDTARKSLKTAVDEQTDHAHASANALASIAASLLLIAEKEAGGEEERHEHHVH